MLGDAVKEVCKRGEIAQPDVIQKAGADLKEAGGQRAGLPRPVEKRFRSRDPRGQASNIVAFKEAGAGAEEGRRKREAEWADNARPLSYQDEASCGLSSASRTAGEERTYSAAASHARNDAPAMPRAADSHWS